MYFFTLRRKIYLLGKERFEIDSIIISEIEQGLGNFKDILIYNMKKIFTDKFNIVTFKLNKNLRYINILTQSTRILLEQFGIIIIIVLAPLIVIINIISAGGKMDDLCA